MLLQGLVLAVILTLASFWAAETNVVWGPSLPALLGVLAIAQMGVYVIFFLHISSAPDNTNSVLALAFGVFGSMIIVGNLNANMMGTRRLIRCGGFAWNAFSVACRRSDWIDGHPKLAMPALRAAQIHALQ